MQEKKKKEEKKLAVFDIDGTIFRKNLHFELLDELVYMKIFDKSVRNELVRLYGNWLNHEGTYEAYRDKLVQLYEKHLKGCYQKDIEKASKKVADFNAKRVYVYTRDLIEKYREEFCMIVISGSPEEIVKCYAEIFNFNAHFGSVYEVDENGIYTGRTLFEPTKDKGGIVEDYVERKGISLDNSTGVGDTESDAKFLELMDHPIAFNPNRQLKQIAEKSGWKVVVEKKDVIYEI
ncbi:MAG: HAD family phosphatase [Candidatus Moranbacteria bacterium]|nr:HAD family phosphatase [Candidatus Moranbacteria bacterium]